MIVSDEKRTVIRGKGIDLIREFANVIEGMLGNEVLSKDDIIKLVEKVAEGIEKDTGEEEEDKEPDVCAIEISGDKAAELLKVIKKALEDGKNG